MKLTHAPTNHGVSRELVQLFDSMKESVATYTRQGKILFLNTTMCRLLGGTRETLVGRVLWELYPDAVGNDFYLAFQRAATTSEPQHFEFTYPQWARAFDVSIYTVDSILYVLARDITDERAAKERLTVLAEAARESERRKDEFLAMLGHELRNPLAPILSAAQLMRLRGAGAGFGRELAAVERQVGHVVALVDDLLDVSRITRGKVELQRTRLDLGRVVMQAVEMTRSLIEHRGHGLALDVAEGLWVEGDAHRLSQVIANLLTNAARYMEPGGRIALSARAGDGQVQVRVRDGGPGISPELLPRIFDLFAQGPRSLERREGGLGLGLYIVRSIVALHGGSVEVTTVLGQGSDFVVTLPLANETDRVAYAGRGAVRSVPPMVARKVLVVDDNADAATLIAEGLRVHGCEVRVAHEAAEALELVRDFQPEVAVLDIGLPGIDGWELGRRLREMPGLSRVRLVAITGYGQSSDRERSAEAGFAAHLVKPVGLDGLLATLA